MDTKSSTGMKLVDKENIKIHGSTSYYMKYIREETFNNFGDKLNRKTVVHNWYVSVAYFSPLSRSAYYSVVQFIQYHFDWAKTFPVQLYYVVTLLTFLRLEDSTWQMMENRKVQYLLYFCILHDLYLKFNEELIMFHAGLILVFPSVLWHLG